MDDPSAGTRESSSPPAVVILLGASNLARASSALTRYIQRNMSPRSVEVLTALGPGRGYHARGGVLNVVYPPISECDWFTPAQDRVDSGAAAVALVTDIGNDILYGASADQILESLDRVLSRLEKLRAEVWISLLPEYFERKIAPWKFYLLRTILYPKSTTCPTTVPETVTAINEGLRQRAGDRVHLLPEMDSFLGWDHVHYGRFKAARAWTLVGRELLRGLGHPSQARIPIFQMLKSYRENIVRCLWVDMLKQGRKPTGYF